MRHLFVANDPTAPGGRSPFVLFVRVAGLLARAGNSVVLIAPDADLPCAVPEGVTLQRVAWADRAAQDRSIAARALTIPEAVGAFSGPFPGLAWSCLAEREVQRALASGGFDVIHAPDFEAPLYTTQVMRACGLWEGTAPPIVMHLLQQSEDRAIANDEDVYAPANVQAWRAERFSCAVADAWVCPSAWFRDSLEKRHAIGDGDLVVIPPPVRSPASAPPAGFVLAGDIEPASGLLELARALRSAPESLGTAEVVVRGVDRPYAPLNSRMTSEQFLRLLPGPLKSRVRVNPPGDARPSGCMLALPRHALAPTPEALDALEAGGQVLATMTAGFDALASLSVRIVPGGADDLAKVLLEAPSAAPAFDNSAQVLDAWMTLLVRVVGEGAARSMAMPSFLPFAGRRGGRAAQRRHASGEGRGIAVVIPHYNLSTVLHEAVETALSQTPRPVDVLVVDDGSTEAGAAEALARAESAGARVLRKRNGGLSAARNSGFADVFGHLGEPPLGVIFLDADDRLRPGCVAACERVLSSRPEIGVVSFWTHHFESVDWYWTNVCPALPFQIHTNEVATFSAYRTEAIAEAGGYREEMFLGYEDWDFTNAIMARGWAAVGIPRILADYRVRADSMLRGMGAHAHGLMVGRMLERTPDALALDPVEISLLGEGIQFQLRGELVVLRGMVARWRRMAHRPDLAAKWALDKLSSRLRQKKK